MNYNFKDLSGQKFSYFTVLELDEIKNGVAKWKCKCECGEIKSIYGTNLTRGLSKSCGCKKSEFLKRGNIDDLSGKRYGRLLVLSLFPTKRGDAYFECICDCGNKKVVKGVNLKRGSVKSCGCLRDEYEPRNKTHGMSNTRLFRIWVGMKQRCTNKNNKKYKIYGERGIKVSEEWLGENGFENFKNWSNNNGYTDKLTIDRINVNGNYEPNNCRWVTAKEQANNTRSTIFITYNGETKPASEWAEIIGIRQDTLTRRKRMGWSDENVSKLL